MYFCTDDFIGNRNEDFQACIPANKLTPIFRTNSTTSRRINLVLVFGYIFDATFSVDDR